MKYFISSQFGYCPLIWMNHSRTLINKIYRRHERSLRVVYNDTRSTFKELLDKDKAVSIQTRFLQLLFTEIVGVNIGVLPPIMHEIFLIDNFNNYNLRKNWVFKPGNPKI